MSSAFSGLIGGGASVAPGISSFRNRTPGFILNSTADRGVLQTNLVRRGTAAQGAADVRIPRILTDIDAVRADIRPGFGRLTDARVLANDRARQRGLGDLRDRLAQRRLQGSSFANADLIRAEREFGEQEERGRAQSFLEELELTTQVLNQEFGVIETELQRELQELGIAANVTTQVGQILETQRQTEASLAASNAANTGSFFSSLAGIGLSAGLNALAPTPLPPTSVNTFGGFQGF